MAIIIKAKESILTSVPSYKKMPVLFVEKWSLLARFLAATGWKESRLLISEAVMFGVCLWIFQMIAEQDQTHKENLPSWTAWPMKVTVRSYETSGSTFPRTERHIPEGFSPQQRAVSTSVLKTVLSSSDSISLIRVYQHPSNGRRFSCLLAVGFLSILLKHECIYLTVSS
jgi:hypothetical protein